MKKSILLLAACWLSLSGTIAKAQNDVSPVSASARIWVQAFNTFDPTANNVVLTLQSGEWVQSISYVRKLELSGPFVRFTYGQDSRRTFRGVADASTIKLITETPLRK